MATFIKGDPAAPEPDDGTTVVYDSAKSAYVPGPTPGGGGGGGGVTVHGDLIGRSAPDQHPIAAITGLQSELNGKAEAVHTHTAAQISDATTTGRAVMQASSPTAARTAIGAGTSNLQLGTGPTTAAAGDHGHDLNAVTDTASRVAMTPAERTKLSGVASGATANATDAQLRDRGTHTGAQAISTVTGLQSALDGKADTGHLHDARYVRTVNGTGPDGNGDVAVAGGGGGEVASFLPPVGFSYPLARNYEGLSGLAGTIGDEYAMPIRGGFSFDRILTRIWAGQTGLTARVGLYADVGGQPASSATAELGIIDLSGGNLRSTTLASPYTLPAGRWWLSIVQQGPTADPWQKAQMPVTVVSPSADLNGVVCFATRPGVVGPLASHADAAWSFPSVKWNDNLPSYSVRRSA